jgi:microcystin-dependent protein
MSNPFLAEIRMFPFNFAPKGWAFCDGQILPISQNTALFSLLGTTYGGNGTSNFALPNLQGSVPLHAAGGAGPGLSLYNLGQSGGESTHTLLQSEMPVHTHTAMASQSRARFSEPSPGVALGRSADGLVAYADTEDTSALVQAGASQVGSSGDSQPHNNLMPFLTLNFCIAMQGVFPARN